MVLASSEKMLYLFWVFLQPLVKGSIVLAVRLPHSRNISNICSVPRSVAEAVIASPFIVINTKTLKRFKNSHSVVLKACKA
jgi:hypothetical protein